MKRQYTEQQVENMCDNLYCKLISWILREGEKRCVTASEIFYKVVDNAPKTIKQSGVMVKKVVIMLWNVDRDYSIDSCEMAAADLNDCMIEYYN